MYQGVVEHSHPRRPNKENNPYTLIVDGNTEASKEVTNGWAELVRELDDGTTQRCVLIEENPTHSRANYISTTEEGWNSGPSILWDFIERIRDTYYEAEIDSREELPLHVETYRAEDDRDNYPDEKCELYFMDSQGGEYIMWNSDELYWVDDDGRLHADSELIQKVLVAVADAYEDPDSFLETFGGHRKQSETI